MVFEWTPESTNLRAPDFGPTNPIYPEIPQMCRVTGAIGNNVYSAFVQQYDTSRTLAMRDRENCYVWEPNGISLGPGIYDTRLVGNYLGLPLYVTTCCPGGSLSSSSSASR